MDQLRNFGYPMPGDNVLCTPASFLCPAVATSTGFVQLFDNQVDQATRNKKFPLSGNEVFVLKELSLGHSQTITTENSFFSLIQSYLQIIINGKETLKIPVLEVFSINDIISIGSGTPVAINQKYEERKKRLKFPIIFNSGDDIVIRLYFNSVSGTSFSSHLHLSGYVFNKITDFDLDLRKGMGLESLSYTFYDVIPLSAYTATDYTLFNVEGKQENLYSKNINLKEEVFQVENVEIFGYSNTVGASLSASIYKSNLFSLIIKNDSQELLNSKTDKMFSIYKYQSGTFADSAGTPVNTNIQSGTVKYGSLTLDKPVILKANSNNLVTLKQPAVYNGSPAYENFNGYYLVMLKGTLTRNDMHPNKWT